MGGVELVRALGMAGIRSAVVAAPGSPPRLSRFAVAGIDPGEGTIVDALLRYGTGQASPPPLMLDSDEALFAVSGARGRLESLYRLALPEDELVRDLADKARFQELAERVGLDDVPAARRVRPAEEPARDLGLRFPLILKPVPFRDARWDRLGEAAKVLLVEDEGELRRLWPRLAAVDLDLLAQEHVPGGEERILSYHVYVDRAGAVAGEFTGRKIRTHPVRFGLSSSVETTADPQVTAAGRDVVERLGLFGPAKLDFKRGPDGRLALLEVNVRFTLWVHPGAVAGVNLPALAYADLLGEPRPATRPARPGVRWVAPGPDLAAARETGVSPARWLWVALRCQTSSAYARDDLSGLWRRRVGRNVPGGR